MLTAHSSISNFVTDDSTPFTVNPSITGLKDGGYVVTWLHGLSDFDLYARQYHADGTPAGDKFVVNNNLSGVIGYDTSVVGLSDGGYIITWTYDVGHDEFGSSVYGQRFKVDGTEVGDEFRINANGYAYESYPNAVQLGDGHVAVTWTDFATIEGQLFSLVPVNHKPAASEDSIATNENSPVSGNVLIDNGHGADSDPDGDALTVVGLNGTGGGIGQTIALASGATVIINPDGRFVYDPSGQFNQLDAGQTASDSFTYTISDGQGHTDAATVNITIAGTEHGLQITNGSGTINGTASDDQIAGGPGNEIIHGGGGYDWLQGSGGQDTLYGEDGSDILDGGDGNDTLVGGPGDDWLIGGPGVDTIVYAPGDDTDVVADFVPGTDRIDLRQVFGVHGLSDLTIVQDGGDSKLVLGSGGIVLKNVNAGDLAAKRFLIQQYD